MDKLTELYNKGLSRRNFLAGVGAVGATSVLAGCSDSGTVTLPTPAPSKPTYTDIDILNFALNLEYLEAEFYLRAATGSGLATADIGTNPGAVTGGAKITVAAGFQQNFLNELAFTEQQHVRFLRQALGSQAVARPAIDLNAGFSGGVTAANSLSAATTTLPLIPAAFNPFASFDTFLVAGFLFEDVGVTAYNGAATLISAAGVTAGYLSAAAGIMATEAYHGASLRTQLTANTITQGYTAYPYLLYANRLSALRAAVGGGAETSLASFSASAGIAASAVTTPSTIVPADSNAIAYARTTDQVLHIVYGTGGTSGVSKGGFFPNGLNGNIALTYA